MTAQYEQTPRPDAFKYLKSIASVAALLTALGATTTSTASPMAVLTQPSQIVALQVEAIEAIASYTIVNDRLELNVTFTEADGSNFNTRVVMIDGQSHAVVLEGDGSDATDARFAFQRTGQSIEVTTGHD